MDSINVENGVLVGNNDELFLAKGNHNPLEYILGDKVVDLESIESFWANIAARASYCAKAGCAFKHVVFPDKHVVQYKDFPLGKVDGLFSYYMEKKWDNSVIYPVSELRGLVEKPYLKYDTHMNMYGKRLVSYLLLKETLEEISFEDHRKILAENIKTARTQGDLSVKLGLGPDDVEVISSPKGARYLSNGVKGGNNGIVDIYINEKSITNKRLLIFGDSFFRSMLSILAYYFNEILFLRTPYFHTEMYNLYRPDVVFTGNVERYLSKVTCDNEARPFFMYRYAKSSEDYGNETKGFSDIYGSLLSAKNSFVVSR
ncbi:hypothetical protein [Microbulbifer variabilis]|uniref:hypothetical protein n=1 Tax=Microbulbifer variabilis TaxID=266805 RepID=UPI000375DB99|nr:hypothetical protein [Microbulbifer variabilis]